MGLGADGPLLIALGLAAFALVFYLFINWYSDRRDPPSYHRNLERNAQRAAERSIQDASDYYEQQKKRREQG